MTVWRPSFAPYLEIHKDLNVNESGYRTFATGFKTILTVKITPKPVNLSSPRSYYREFDVNYSGGEFDVYVNTSEVIYQASARFDATVYGLR